MSMRIEAVEGGELFLSGDLDARIALPTGMQGECFSPAFSDGTLVSGQLREGTANCTFTVQIEGAAIVRIERLDCREALVLDWQMEWMMVGRNVQICAEKATAECAEQLYLGVDTAMRCAA